MSKLYKFRWALLLLFGLCILFLANSSAQAPLADVVAPSTQPKTEKLTCGGFPVSQSSKKPNFNRYILKLNWKIRRNWHPLPLYYYPIVVQFRIDCAGNLSNLVVKKSSGNADADQRALQAVSSSAPFSPLPKNYIGVDIPVEYTFDWKPPGYVP